MSSPTADIRAQAGAAPNPVPLPEALDATRDSFSTLHLKEISYYAGGPDADTGNRPLVLIHSINAAPSAFELKPLYDHYRGSRRVYVPELPGFGFSDRSEREYSPELFANAIIAFLTNVVREPADVVAFSLSSEFAARAALVASERITSLTLLSPTGFSERRLPSGGVGRFMHKVFTLPGLSQGLYDLLTQPKSIRYFLKRSWVGEVPQELIDYAWATARQPGARHAPYYFLAGQLFTRDAAGVIYDKVKQPVLVIHDRDANVSFDLLPSFAAAHRNWRVNHVTPTLGMPQWERPADTIAAMDAFWAEQPGA